MLGNVQDYASISADSDSFGPSRNYGVGISPYNIWHHKNLTKTLRKRLLLSETAKNFIKVKNVAVIYTKSTKHQILNSNWLPRKCSVSDCLKGLPSFSITTLLFCHKLSSKVFVNKTKSTFQKVDWNLFGPSGWVSLCFYWEEVGNILEGPNESQSAI